MVENGIKMVSNILASWMATTDNDIQQMQQTVSHHTLLHCDC